MCGCQFFSDFKKHKMIVNYKENIFSIQTRNNEFEEKPLRASNKVKYEVNCKTPVTQFKFRICTTLAKHLYLTPFLNCIMFATLFLKQAFQTFNVFNSTCFPTPSLIKGRYFGNKYAVSIFVALHSLSLGISKTIRKQFIAYLLEKN